MFASTRPAASEAAVPEPAAAPAEPTLTVVMPVFNERATLEEALRRVRASPVDKEVLVVDDCSSDGTRELLRQEIDGRYADVHVHYLEKNGGKGAAIRAALPFARGRFVIIQDADLEYDPADYQALLRPALEEGAAVVYGSRFTRGWPAMRLPNRVINVLLVGLANLLYDARLTDEATCYKLFRRDVLLGFGLQARRFEFCPEVTAKARRRGHPIVEVPISYEARTHAQGKKIRWPDGVSALWTLVRYRFWR